MHAGGEKEIKWYQCDIVSRWLVKRSSGTFGVSDKVICVIKYFKNHHQPAGWLKSKSGKTLVLPIDVRWNSMVDAMESYISSWSDLFAIAEEHREELAKDIYNIISNVSLKRSVEDYIDMLKPIAITLDLMQMSTANLADAVKYWRDLGEKLNAILPTEKQVLFVKRRKMALSKAHFLCFLLDPRYVSEKILTQEEEQLALSYAAELHSKLVEVIAKFRIKASPFSENYYAVANAIAPCDWWKLFDIDGTLLAIIQAILACIASTAPIERLFSTFGWVQSKQRNRLGTEKAAKLVFCFKILNQ